MSRGSSTTQITVRVAAGRRRRCRTRRALGDVEAALAERDPVLGLGDRAGPAAAASCSGTLQQVEGDALGRLGADAGQAAELVDEVLDGPA